jgi:hypothetical protein
MGFSCQTFRENLLLAPGLLRENSSPRFATMRCFLLFEKSLRFCSFYSSSVLIRRIIKLLSI